MTDYSVYFKIGLFPEDTIAKDDIFDNYLCNENQVEYVINYLNDLYSTSYYKSKGINGVDYNGVFIINVKINSDDDWKSMDWFNDEKLFSKAYEILIPKDNMKLDINGTTNFLKIKIIKCMGYVTIDSWNDHGDY